MSNLSYTSTCGVYLDILKTMWHLNLTESYAMGVGIDNDTDTYFIAWIEQWLEMTR